MMEERNGGISGRRRASSQASSRAPSATRARSFSARLRSRSTSKSRTNGHGPATKRPQPQQDDPSRNSSSSNQSTTGQIDGIVERHQCAMKTDLQEFIEACEKEEVEFWKDKAINLKKRASFLEREVRDRGEEGSDKGNDQIKVSQLEIKLQNRDVQLVSLREVMASQENASEERVRLLEHQLERLVELQTKVRSGSFQRPPSTASTQNPTSDPGRSNISDSRKVAEISALEQLLAQALAEKDRLQYENDNLRSVVREEGSRSNDVTEDKPSISNDGPNVKRSRSCGPVDTKPPISHDAPNHSASTSDETRYKLSCRSFPEQSFAGVTSENLKKTVNKHFLDVWEIVRTLQGRGRRTTLEAERDQDGAGNNFRDSILAHYIAEVHCRDMECEKDVHKWCKKNLKLEKIVAADSPIAELTRSALSSSC